MKKKNIHTYISQPHRVSNATHKATVLRVRGRHGLMVPKAKVQFQWILETLQ